MAKFSVQNWARFEDFLPDLLPAEQPIILHLRELILAAAPQLEERSSYGVPYYFRRSRVCFLWPVSRGWGAFADGVQLGFVRGNLLSNENGLFKMEARKEVGMVVFQKVSDINDEQILETLAEALLLDEEIFQAKRRG